MTNDELIQSYRRTYHQACWYNGNNPGLQARLTKDANELARQLRGRGLRPEEYKGDIDQDHMAIYRPVTSTANDNPS
jgi:hypothetical protein